LTVGVAPDNIYDTIVAQLEQAQESIYIEGYGLTHIHFGRVISDLIASRGLSVTVLLDTALYGENREKWICQQIEQAGGEVYLMHNLDDNKRYREQHAKFIIVDERVVIIGSENYGYGAMPIDDRSDGTYGNRGAVLITDAGPVVAWALDVFRADADPARRDVTRWGTRGFDPPPIGYTPPVTTGGGSGYHSLAPQPLSVEEELFFEVIQSPETSLSFERGLIGLLLRAGPGDTILVEMLNENKHWGGVAGDIAADPNPRLEAYVQAARQGATVRVLFDEEITVGSNREAMDYLNAVAVSETLDLQARAQNPTGAGIHNKLVLARIGGRGYAFVSSINGTAASNRRNRELGLLVQSDAAYEYLAQIFKFDWQPVKQVYLPLLLRDHIGPARHLLVSEVYYNPPNDPGQEETVEWIELYNPTNASVDLSLHKLGDAAAPGDPEGMYRFPAGATIGPGQVLVVALEATEFSARYGFNADFEFLSGSPAVPDMVDYPAWGTFQIGLRNAGDEVLLLDGEDGVVDVLAWGDSPYPCLPHPGVAHADHSLERYPADRDTGDCSGDFRDWFAPSPGSVP
jgi:phosphatidylserine/phosphatidylglycerophosphate/cardiolipin synthase-like enzyme